MSVPPNYPPSGGYNNPPPGNYPPQGGYPQPGGYGMPPPKKSNALPWILGLGCGIPLLFFFGCIAVVGPAMKKVISDPQVQKQIQDAQRQSQAGGSGTSAAPGTLRYDPSTFQTKSTGLGQEITGTVTNTTDQTLPYVHIKFAVLDASGTQIGTTFTNTTNLQPHADWNFSASILNKGATKWKLIGVDTKVL